MKTRSVAHERRVGAALLGFSAVMLAGMLALWWLVENTNKEGEHDANLLPYFALIPFGIGLYHLVRARWMRTHGRA
jgi:apolipoprotein N-acyltransferase